MKIALVANHAGHQHVEKFEVSLGSPVSIGRSWKNDVVINDEYLDAEHAELNIDENQHLVIRDLNTCNGTYIGRKKVKDAQSLEIEKEVVVGDTTFTVFNQASAVVPAQKRNWAIRITRAFSSWPGIMFVTAVLLLAVFAEVFLLNSYHSKEDQATEFVGVLIMLTGWTIIAGFFSKMFKQKTHLKSHWIFCCLIATCTFALFWLTKIVDFNIPSNSIQESLAGAVQTFTMFALSIGTLSLATRLSFKKRLGLSSAFALTPLIIAATFVTTQTDKQKWNDVVYIENFNQPPLFQFSQPEPVEEHFAGTDELFTMLDERVAVLATERRSSPKTQLSQINEGI